MVLSTMYVCMLLENIIKFANNANSMVFLCFSYVFLSEVNLTEVT